MAEKQRTLKDVAVVRGIGAFTGDDVTVEIYPAPVDHGPSFELDRGGSTHSIPVSVENILEAENRTVLADIDHPDRQINIVEHVLATLHGLGIDNALIRVDSTEIPMIDGSALPFLQAIDSVGVAEQDAPRREIVIERPVFVDDGAVLLVLPFDGLRITYYLDQPEEVVGKRAAQIDVTPENFRKRIAPARTFITADKADDLLESGDVKHADTSQVLIVFGNHTSQPLRFADEFCYHKMLDILGDLYLLGRRLRGQVVGVRSGHHQNRKMARKLAGEYL